MLRIANKYSTFRWGFAPNPNLDTAFLSHIVLWPMYLHLQIYIYCLSSLKCSILTTLKVKHQRRKCFNLLKILKILLGLCPRHYSWYYSPRHTVLWCSVVYCWSISSFEGLILTSIKSHIFELTTKCPNMLEILKHKRQKFCWGFAPDTILDITLPSSASQSFGLQLSTAQV